MTSSRPDRPAHEDEAVLAAARAGDEQAFARLVTPFRRELKAHCYRMSGSLHDAEDLVQDALLRAWRGLGAFEGRASLRTWLYKVATNACLNALAAKKARGLPMDQGVAGDPTAPMTPELDPIWLEPCPEELYANVAASPEAATVARESVALAFLAALQLLPAAQRAILILHDVLGFRADECAELLDLTAAAVNSALQRARTTLAGRTEAWRTSAAAPPEPEDRALLQRYIGAWESADVPALVALLHEDATLSMPPFPTWLRGANALGSSLQAMVFDAAERGQFRLVPTRANGAAALAVYRRDAASGEHRPYALHLVEARGGRITAITAFLDTSLFAPFGLPPRA